LISLIRFPFDGVAVDLNRSEDHVTCGWPFRITRKRSPAILPGGKDYRHSFGMNGFFGFTRFTSRREG